MATARFITNLALQKLGVLGAGRDARQSDATDALSALQALYGAWIAGGAFGRLRDVVPQGTTYTTSGNERILRTSAEQMEIVLPELVSEAHYNDYGVPRRGYYGTIIEISNVGDNTVIDVRASQPIGCVEPPRDGSAVIITDRVGGERATWLYDGTVKQWQGIERMTLEDDAPRSSADPQGLAACLAMEIADSYGDAGVVGPSAQAQAARFKAAMTQRFGMRREQSVGVYM